MAECDTCDRDDVDWTTSIVVEYGEVEMCKDCITEDADKVDANTAALQREE